MPIDTDKYPYSTYYESNPRNAGSVAKRVNEIKLFLEDFIDIKHQDTTSRLRLISNDLEEVARIISESYYKIYFQFKPFVTSKGGTDDNYLNIYKVISGLELAVCEVRPILMDTQSKRAEINAELAFYLGLNFLIGFFQDNFLNYRYLNASDGEKEEVTNLVTEHITWLSMLQGGFHLPYFSNAHTWWALKLLLVEFNEQR